MDLTFPHKTLQASLVFAAVAFSSALTGTAQDASTVASEMAKGMEDGSSLTRLRMVIKSGGGKSTLNMQIKARRSQGKSDVLYQVIFPASRKGESVLLAQSGTSTPSGYSFTPPAKAAIPLTKANLTGSVFGSDLAYLDLIENFFRWGSQSIVGQETVGRAECVVLESKPGSSDSTPYGSVKTWVDTKRMVAMKVEKYDRSGNLLRQIETLQAARIGTGRTIPTKLLVRRAGGGTETELDGSNIRHDVDYSEEDFTVQKMTTLR